MSRSDHDEHPDLDLSKFGDKLKGPVEEVEKEIRREYVESEKGYHDRRRRHIGLATGLARYYYRCRSAWVSFINRHRADPFAKSLSDDDDLIKICNAVSKFLIGARNDEDIDRALKYSKIMEYYIRQRVEPVDVPEAIEDEGGIQSVIDRATKSFPRRVSNSGNNDAPFERNDNDASDQQATDAFRAPVRSGARSSSGRGHNGQRPQAADFRRDNPELVRTEILTSQADFDNLKRVHREGQIVNLVLMPKHSANSWFHFHARSIDDERDPSCPEDL